MEHCEFCHAELPESAQFCGSCGEGTTGTRGLPTHMSHFSGSGNNQETMISSSSYPSLRASDQPTINLPLAGGDATLAMDEEVDEEEEKRRRLLLAGLPFAAGLAQSGSPDIPMVQGTPQISSVPTVSGIPNVSVASSGGAQLAGAGASSGSVLGAVHPQTPAPVMNSWPPASHGTDIPLPSTHPTPTPPPHGNPSPNPNPVGCLFNWFTLLIIVLVIVGSIGTVIIGFSPGLSLVGNSSVSVGGVLHLHGHNFIPGSSVTFTLDEHVPLLLAQQDENDAAYTRTDFSANVTDMMLSRSVSRASVTVSGTGAFDVVIPVGDTWTPGTHTIRARESLSARSAVSSFIVTGPLAHLYVGVRSLDFGTVEVDSKAVLPVVISNSGSQPLQWTADAGTTAWLNLQPARGTVAPGKHEQIVYVTCDTTRLQPGTYSSTLHIQSNGGSTQIGVKVEVVAKGANTPAKMNITPASLDFGTMAAGTQGSQALTIGNTGNQDLNWQADTGNTSWLTLDTTSGTVKAGDVPQTLNVSVDTSSLSAGRYSATINLTSNGGNIQVPVTLVVRGVSNQPCTLQGPAVTTETFTAKAGTNPPSQSFTVGVTGNCSGTVTITPTITVKSGRGWLQVDPPSAAITGGSTTFTVSVASSALGVGTYDGAISLFATDGNGVINGSPQVVNVTLNVSEVPPVLEVSPGTLNFSLSNGDGASSQTLTIANTGGSSLDWTATLNNAPGFVTLSSGAGKGLAGGASTPLQVQVNPAEEDIGTYSLAVVIQATDPLTGNAAEQSPITIPVNITITAHPALQLSSNSLSFTPGNCQTATPQSVIAGNAGGGTLTWSTDAPASWLTVSPTTGSDGAGINTTVTFTVNGAGLNPGQTYTAIVTFTPSYGSTQRVVVTFVPPYCIQ